MQGRAAILDEGKFGHLVTNNELEEDPCPCNRKCGSNADRLASVINRPRTNPWPGGLTDLEFASTMVGLGMLFVQSTFINVPIFRPTRALERTIKIWRAEESFYSKKLIP